MQNVYTVKHYIDAQGKDHVQEYLDSMRGLRAHVRIWMRIDRVKLGNFDDHKQLAENFFELRIDVGKGYRVYYTMQSGKIVLLLCAGDKSSQPKDIKRAMQYKLDYEQFTQQN